MRKRLALCVLAIGLSPFAAGADDIADGADCKSGNAQPYTHHYQSLEDPTTGDPSNADRSSTCIYANGIVLFYIGGELQAEEQPEFGGTCGSIIVAGDETLTSGSGQDWNNAGPDRQSGTADDSHCN